jgi:hypothetical protein
MKVGSVICGPDAAYGPLALLSGTFEEEVQGRRPSLDPQVVTGELFGSDGLRLVTPDDDLY